MFNEVGNCVGIAFQGYSADEAENIGYVIPTPVIEHFLTDFRYCSCCHNLALRMLSSLCAESSGASAILQCQMQMYCELSRITTPAWLFIQEHCQSLQEVQLCCPADPDTF